MDYLKEYGRWHEKTKDNEEIFSELLQMDDDEELIKERFHKNLEFGTAGLRGILGAGTNAVNIYTIRKVTQGFADFLKTQHKEPTAVISYDSRINSELFAREAAKVFAANQVRVYLFSHLAATPILSYAVRFLEATGGVMITASHNPAEYNGYKAYNSKGAQLTTEAADQTLEFIEKLDIFDDVECCDFDYGIDEKLIEYVDDQVIRSYLEETEKLSYHSDENGINAKLKVAYTPLYGAGYGPVKTILERVGIADLAVVEEQKYPDGTFPTAPYPNPEFKEALELGLKLGTDIEADILIATDPDADRLGVAIFDKNGYTILSGNEVGVLIFYYILNMREAAGKMPENPVAVRSIVSSTLIDSLAKDHGVAVKSVLTGFKNVAEYIEQLELQGREADYIFGYEEACGYLPSTYVRDKDAISSAMLICEMAAFYKTNGQTLMDVLNEIYEDYGFYYHPTLNYTFQGIEGKDKIDNIMQILRTNPPAEIAGVKLVSILDYQTGIRKEDGIEKTENLPKTNAIVMHFEDNTTIIARPSGTEPKIKFYFSIIKPRKDAGITKTLMQEDLEEKLSLVKEKYEQ